MNEATIPYAHCETCGATMYMSPDASSLELQHKGSKACMYSGPRKPTEREIRLALSEEQMTLRLFQKEERGLYNDTAKLLLKEMTEKAAEIIADLKPELDYTMMGWLFFIPLKAEGAPAYLLVGAGADKPVWGATAMAGNEEMMIANYESDLPELCASGELLARWIRMAVICANARIAAIFSEAI